MKRVPTHVPFLTLAAFSIGLYGLRPSGAEAWAQEISGLDELTFSTSGQSLWGPREGQSTKSFRAAVLDIDETSSFGNIVRVDSEVSNQSACDDWERAVSECDAYVYRKKIVFKEYEFSPSRQQCIDGYSFPWPFSEFFDPVPGIGPKPPCVVTRPFDAGAEAAWRSVLRWGVQGGITVDEGSVDVEMRSQASLEVAEEAFEPGDVITLRTREISPDVNLQSRWPGVSGRLDTFLEASSTLTATAAYPDTQTGEQIRESKRLIEVGTAREERQQLAGFRAGTGGLKLRILDGPEIGVLEGVEHTVVVGFTPPASPVEVGLAVCDLGLYFPQMDTPAGPEFLGEALNGTFDGARIVNRLRPGPRGAFDFGRINHEGTMDVDVGRFDIDIDFLATVALGLPLGGINASIGKGPVSLFEVEANLYDIDAAIFLGFEEDLTFEPRLEVELRFSLPTMVETAPGSNRFEVVSSRRVRVGEDLRLVYPGPGLAIDPVYTLAANRFINDTDLILSPAIQGYLLQLKLGGVIVDAGVSAFGLPENVAAGQVTVDLKKEPLKLADLNFLDDSSRSEFPLQGFREVAGRRMEIRPKGGEPFRRGDTNSDAASDLSDGVRTLGYLFLGLAEPACLRSADTNADGAVDLTDVVALLGHLFLGAPEPAAPFRACGADPGSPLNCNEFTPCG